MAVGFPSGYSTYGSRPSVTPTNFGVPTNTPRPTVNPRTGQPGNPANPANNTPRGPAASPTGPGGGRSGGSPASPNNPPVHTAQPISGPEAEKRAEQHKIDDFYNYAKQTGTELQNLTANPDDVNRYYKEADAPIQSQFYDQAGNVASYLARQGLGSSAGINVAASQQLSNNKAALESQARLQATNKALELGRQKLLDAFSVNAMGLQPGLQKYGIDVGATIAQLQLQAQMKMFQEQMDAQNQAGWGNLLGSLGGAGIMALALSDERLKYDIVRHDDALSGVPFASWKWLDDGSNGFGVIAQDLEKVLPQYVYTLPNGIKMVDYSFLWRV